MNGHAIPQMSEEENVLAGGGEGDLPATNAQLLMPSGCIFLPHGFRFCGATGGHENG